MTSPLATTIAAAAIVWIASAGVAMADEVGFPCEGCVVLGSPGKAPRPLVVVLHGDEGGPSRVVGAWRPAIAKADVTLFAPKCPVSEQCAGSFWRWNGAPKWLFDQIDRVAEKYPVDPSRRYLAGWSGGSTYLTWHMSEWFPEFAAVSIAGGGAPEGGGRCFARAGGTCAPVHYLMGSGNPLFDLATGARDRITACGHDLTWQLLPGADHEHEWQTYTTKTGDILTWLLARSEGCTPPPAPSSSASTAASASPAETSAAPAPATSLASAPSPTDLPPARISPCTCALPGDARDAAGPAVGLAIALCIAAARRAQRFER